MPHTRRAARGRPSSERRSIAWSIGDVWTDPQLRGLTLVQNALKHPQVEWASRIFFARLRKQFGRRRGNRQDWAASNWVTGKATLVILHDEVPVNAA
jgi:hypothetical protein